MTDYTISHGSRHMNGFGKMHSARLRHKLLWGALLDDWLDALAWQIVVCVCVLSCCPVPLVYIVAFFQHSDAFWCFSHVGIVQFELVISAGIIRWTWLILQFHNILLPCCCETGPLVLSRWGVIKHLRRRIINMRVQAKVVQSSTRYVMVRCHTYCIFAYVCMYIYIIYHILYTFSMWTLVLIIWFIFGFNMILLECFHNCAYYWDQIMNIYCKSWGIVCSWVDIFLVYQRNSWCGSIHLYKKHFVFRRNSTSRIRLNRIPHGWITTLQLALSWRRNSKTKLWPGARMLSYRRPWKWRRLMLHDVAQLSRYYFYV